MQLEMGTPVGLVFIAFPTDGAFMIGHSSGASVELAPLLGHGEIVDDLGLGGSPPSSFDRIRGHYLLLSRFILQLWLRCFWLKVDVQVWKCLDSLFPEAVGVKMGDGCVLYTDVMATSSSKLGFIELFLGRLNGLCYTGA